jgi:UDP-glucose 4-epimerase
MMFSVVTGGAGFIGSHIVDALVAQGDRVLVIDDLSTGDRANLAAAEGSGRVEFLAADLLADGWQQAIAGADRVFHIAADPDVRGGAASPDAMFRYSVVMTERVLEAMREQQVSSLIFTSTSTVYGEATVIPTPESYTPMEPISVYGAGKLASEAIISAYCHSFGMKAWVFRFANVIGARSNHGILWDFMHKLKQNPTELEILGDGTQTKSYIEVHACVEAILYVLAHADQTVNTYNIGSEDWIDVTGIADLVVGAMGLTGVTYHYTGGKRGWVGDVPKMQLAVDRLKALGWTPTINSRESMEIAMKAMLEDQA